MDRAEITSILNKLINEYLNNAKDRKNIVKKLASKISVDEVLSLRDELLTSSYYALKYLDDDFQTPDCEIQYLKECFDGKRLFTQTERDKYIIKVTSDSRYDKGTGC